MQIKITPTTRPPGIITNDNIIKETECGKSYDVRRNSLLVKGVNTKVEKVIYKILGSDYCLYFLCPNYTIIYYLFIYWSSSERPKRPVFLRLVGVHKLR